MMSVVSSILDRIIDLCCKGIRRSRLLDLHIDGPRIHPKYWKQLEITTHNEGDVAVTVKSIRLHCAGPSASDSLAFRYK